MSPRRLPPIPHEHSPGRRVVSLPVAALVALVTALAGGGGGAAINKVASDSTIAFKERLAHLEGRQDSTDRTLADLREARADTAARLVAIERSLASIEGKLDRLSDGASARRR